MRKLDVGVVSDSLFHKYIEISSCAVVEKIIVKTLRYYPFRPHLRWSVKSAGITTETHNFDLLEDAVKYYNAI